MERPLRETAGVDYRDDGFYTDVDLADGYDPKQSDAMRFDFSRKAEGKGPSEKDLMEMYRMSEAGFAKTEAEVTDPERKAPDMRFYAGHGHSAQEEADLRTAELYGGDESDYDGKGGAEYD